MTPRSQIFVFSTIAVSGSLASIMLFGRGSAHEVRAAKPVQPIVPTSAAPEKQVKPAELIDAALASHRAELLTLAFDTASALPTHPHAKNRCRMQEDVVTACLNLEQPRRALTYIEKIDNWRRGSTYADLAQYLARHGGAEQVDRYLALADEVAERKKSDPSEQDWRPDLIRRKIASVLVAASPEEQTFDFAARVAELDAMVDHGGLEETMRALMEFATLYDLNYASESRRNMLYSKVRNSWSKSPIQIRFETMLELADSALAHEDPGTALVLAAESRELLGRVAFASEDRIPLVARLADLLRRAGDTIAARAELDAALALYDQNEPDIVDIYRSRALRALAEQYKQVGDTRKALEIYARAIEAGAMNPNSRPRADDLMAVCCSLARNDVEPGEALLKRLREIRAGLRDPW